MKQVILNKKSKLESTSDLTHPYKLPESQLVIFEDKFVLWFFVLYLKGLMKTSCSE